MKSVIMILGASALVSAQQMPDNFPKCGLVCIPNMVNQASAFKCESGDWRCLCSSKNFIYGVRDCADQACPKQEEASAVKAFGKNQCAAVGIDIEGVPGSVTGSNPSATTTVMATGQTGSASASASGSQSAVTTSDILSTMTSDGSAITSTVGQTTIFGGVPVPISTQDVLTTIESDGSSITSTIGKSTIFSTSAASGSGSANPSETQSGSASVTTNTSEVETTVTTDGSTFTTKTQAGSTSTTEPEAPASSSPNSAAMKTVAPAGAFFAAGAFGLFML